MSTVELIAAKVRELPPEKQEEVLDFVERLRAPGPRKLRDPRGLWKGLHISREDIDEVRREMWRNFPRDDM